MPSFNYADTIRRIFIYIIKNKSFFSANLDIVELIGDSSNELDNSVELNTDHLANECINQFMNKVSDSQRNDNQRKQLITELLNCVADIGLLVHHVVSDSALHKKVFSRIQFEKIEEKKQLDAEQIPNLLSAILPHWSVMQEIKQFQMFKSGYAAYILANIAKKLINYKFSTIVIPDILTSLVGGEPYLEGKCESDITRFCEGFTWQIDIAQEKINFISLSQLTDPTDLDELTDLSNLVIDPLEKILATRAANLKTQRLFCSVKNRDFLNALCRCLKACIINIEFIKEFNIIITDSNIENITNITAHIKQELETLATNIVQKQARLLTSEAITHHRLFQYAPRRIHDVAYARNENAPLMVEIFKYITKVEQLLLRPTSQITNESDYEYDEPVPR